MGSNIPAGTEGSPTPPTVPPLPAPSFGTHMTVLSIDGGGIRGLIPSVIVAELERMLQVNKQIDLLVKFDVIAGTSTGALLTACLVTPDIANPARPLKAARDIIQFYLEEGPNIFPENGLLYKFCNLITMGLLDKVSSFKQFLIGGPRYDGEHFHNTIRELTREVRLSETLTGVMVPVFDVRYMSATMYCSAKNQDPGLCDDMLLSELLIGTSVVQHEATGTYTAEDCAKWSAFDWIYNRRNKHTPLLDIFPSATDKFVDFYTAMLLESHHCSNYLRIQSQCVLEGPTALMDNATPNNMDKLIEIGEELLEKQVYRVDAATGRYELDTRREWKNKDALEHFAGILSSERNERLTNMENRDNTASSSSVE